MKSNARKTGGPGHFVRFVRFVGSLAERRNGWLGREGSNLRMAELKSAAWSDANSRGRPVDCLAARVAQNLIALRVSAA